MPEAKKKHLTNRTIEKAALNLGVTQAALYKWRSRGVPYKYRVILVQRSNGQIKLSDFPDHA